MIDSTSTAGRQPGELVDHLFRDRSGQMVAYLTRVLGPDHLDLAEEVVQEALLKALQTWPHSGVPDNPAGWLFQVARNTAMDAIRHRSLVIAKADAVAAERETVSENPDGLVSTGFEAQLRDDELRMVLMCCHPALPRDSRVALSLKTVGGLSVREIARAFLCDEATIAQRIVRAKRQIREDQIPFELPVASDLAARLESALDVVYLMFNEGYAAQCGEDLIRLDLCREALRLGRLLATSSVGTQTAHALVALMAFQAARIPARVDSAGEMVLLEDQDRNLWDRNLIAMGVHHFSESAEGLQLSTYHIQAAIAAAHATGATDWKHILGLYDELMELDPSPIVALNRAVALAKVEGPESALQALECLRNDRALRNYYLLPAVRGRLQYELGDYLEAAASFQSALRLPCSDPERRFLQRQLQRCEQSSSPSPHKPDSRRGV